MDVAVDCPTRERNAWTGDSQIYTKTAARFMNVYSFYEKWLQDQTIEQYASGKVGITFPSTSSLHNQKEYERLKPSRPGFSHAGPEGNGSPAEDSAGWGDAAVWNPYMIYLSYGDRQILNNQYHTAQKWVDYMLACAKEPNPLYADQPQYHTYAQDGRPDAEYIYDTRMHFGEWLEPIPQEDVTALTEPLEVILKRMTEQGNPLVATAYMCRSAANVAHMAQILGKEADRTKYAGIAAKIKQVYDKYLIQADGTINPGHQAAYVRALAFDLCSPEKQAQVLNKLLEEIKANDDCLNTGFLSTPFLLPVLVDHGHTELAFRILEQTKNPGWLHAVELGATTILESWDGLDKHRASYNHYSYGAVCDFLFGYIAGIRPDFNRPGYKAFVLKPLVGGTLTDAEAEYESLYGKIVSGWERRQNIVNYHCTIPENTSADVTLPDGRSFTLGSGSYRFCCQL